jgi:hypothetical protein
VYDYYGRLYERDARFQWAAMANLIGPSFYAGFLDVGLIPDAERALVAAFDRGISTGRRAARTLLRSKPLSDTVTADGWGFFETTFLTMQRKIFEDQAPMHEAYLDGGLDAIANLASAGIIDSVTAQAWTQIDSDDPSAIREGNRTLLFREQHDIIDRYYANMRAYDPPQGKAFTYLLTLAGSPAIPAAKGYPAIFPLTLVSPAPGGSVAIRTPLPDGNIAIFADRWDLIERDTLPAFERFISDDAAKARALISTPITARARRFRTIRRLGAITTALTHWQIRFDEEPHAPRWPRLARNANPPNTIAGEVTIDLSTPPTRASANLPPLSEHRVWGTGFNTFPLSVNLPGGRRYAASAQLAVLLSPARTANPTRLTIKLPPGDLQEAQSTLATLAHDWAADTAEIAQWGAAASTVTPEDHAYSTHVFRAEPIDLVRLEFQVEHHVVEQQYVIDVLFFWNADASAQGTTTGNEG